MSATAATVNIIVANALSAVTRITEANGPG